MTTFETASSSTTTGAPQTLVLPRRHLIAIAILLCVPLPLLSLAATVVPLPGIVERAAATFISVAAPMVGTDDQIDEKAVVVRPVEITYRRSELRPASHVRTSPTSTAGASMRGTSSKEAGGKDAVPAGGQTAPAGVTVTAKAPEPASLRSNRAPESKDPATDAAKLRTKRQSAPSGNSEPHTLGKKGKGPRPSGESRRGGRPAGGGGPSHRRSADGSSRRVSSQHGKSTGRTSSNGAQQTPSGKQTPPGKSGNGQSGGGSGSPANGAPAHPGNGHGKP